MKAKHVAPTTGKIVNPYKGDKSIKPKLANRSPKKERKHDAQFKRDQKPGQ